MKKSGFIFIFATLFGLAACIANVNTNPTEDPNYFLTATIVPFYTHVPSPTVIGPPANVLVALNMGGGGAGFSANIYAQEVNTGQTFTTFICRDAYRPPAAHLPTGLSGYSGTGHLCLLRPPEQRPYGVSLRFHRMQGADRMHRHTSRCSGCGAG
jgi:hypothetical protein